MLRKFYIEILPAFETVLVTFPLQIFHLCLNRTTVSSLELSFVSSTIVYKG